MTLVEKARAISVRYEVGGEARSLPLRLPGWAFYRGSLTDLHGLVLVESLCGCDPCVRAGAETYELLAPRIDGEVELAHVRLGSLLRLVTRPAEQPASFDALAHTVTVDGDWPRCAECGGYGSHEECQPDELAGAADSAVSR